MVVNNTMQALVLAGSARGDKLGTHRSRIVGKDVLVSVVLKPWCGAGAKGAPVGDRDAVFGSVLTAAAMTRPPGNRRSERCLVK